jgi:branched-chain amino acid transport system substrate-binding protein
MNGGGCLGAGTAAALMALASCLPPPEDQAPPQAIPVALLLSYTGTSAAESINSERAVQLAIERVNAAGGVGGRPLRLVAHNIKSDGARTVEIINELVAQRVAVFIGPDSPNAVNQLILTHRNHTLFLPSVALSARDFIFSARNWFTFAPNTWALACAFKKQLETDGITRPLILHNPDSFHTELAVALKMALAAANSAIVVPDRRPLGTPEVEEVLRRAADGLLLITFPESAASVVSELSFRSQGTNGRRWYLSPTLRTPRFFANIPAGALLGALGPGPAAVYEAAAFKQMFQQRWSDEPLDEAFAFYDATALAALAMQQALVTGEMPSAVTLGGFVRKVASATDPDEPQFERQPVRWNELGRGLELISSGQRINYEGVSGRLDFNALGDPRETLVQWWRVEKDGPVDVGEPVATAVASGAPCPP